MAEEAVQDRITVLGPSTFLPKMRMQGGRRRKYQPYFLPIFPRYLFVQLDLPADKDLIGIIARYPGAFKFLGASVTREFPLALRDSELEHLRLTAEHMSAEIILTNERPSPLSAETFVRILWGPFEGRVAKVEFDNGARVDLLLAAAGVASKLNLPRELIEAVS